MESKGLSVLTESRCMLGSAEGAIPIAPAPEHIEALKGESWRIDLRMARFACSLGPMLCQLLSNRCRAANIRLNGRHRWWWRRYQPTKDSLIDPDAAQNRRCGGAI